MLYVPQSLPPYYYCSVGVRCIDNSRIKACFSPNLSPPPRRDHPALYSGPESRIDVIESATSMASRYEHWIWTDTCMSWALKRLWS